MDKEHSNLPVQESSDRFKFRVEEAVLIFLLVLSLVGVALTDFSATDAWWYWMAMIFIFGLAAVITGLLQAKEKSHGVRDLLAVQTIHWFGSMTIVIAAFSLLHAGALDEQGTGLVILLILSLATFLDGIRLGWRFSMVGVFLGITAVIIAHIENFMLLVLALALSIIVITVYWDKRRMKRPSSVS